MDTRESPVTTTSKGQPCQRDRSDSTRSRSFAWLTRHNPALTIAAASVAPVLYLVYIQHYATDVLSSDDWNLVPMVHAALHGHLSLNQLWSQYNESRLFVGNLVFVLFAFVDHLNLRAVIVLGAAALIASYAGLLLLLRQYLGKHLTPIPVLLVGVIWFSLADSQNAIWAFQVSWYLTVFFFIMMLVVLLLPDNHRSLWFVVAVLVAAVASLTTVQGFLCWPVGAICLLWNGPSSSRVRFETTVWLSSMAITLALYLPGYRFGEGNTCLPLSSCTPDALAHHPLTVIQFYLALVGDIIPATAASGGTVHDVARFEAIGLVLLAAAVFVLIQSWRHRSTERLPLPLLLIVFSLLFDVIVTLGRGGLGASGAIVRNRFVIANLILLTGVVIYAWAHLPSRNPRMANGPWRVYVTYLALITLAIFLAVQVTTATNYGLSSSDADRNGRITEARVLVYRQFNRVISEERACQLALTLYFEPPEIKQALGVAIADRLGEFRPSSDRYYHELGPPPVPPACKARYG
jgi:hypothetical protein